MKILVGYGIGPQTERILRFYWEHLFMVAQAERYYSNPFKVHQGVTQGYPLSPTLFNMIMDAVICHWVTLFVREELVPEGFG